MQTFKPPIRVISNEPEVVRSSNGDFVLELRLSARVDPFMVAINDSLPRWVSVAFFGTVPSVQLTCEPDDVGYAVELFKLLLAREQERAARGPTAEARATEQADMDRDERRDALRTAIAKLQLGR